MGSTIYGFNSNYFGYSVSSNSDGSIIAVTERYGDSDIIYNVGAVHIFKNLNNKWTRIKLIHGENTGDYAGEMIYLSSDGTVVAIGALYNDDNGNNSGHVRIFKN